MALSKFTSHSLRNVFVGRGLTSVQHSLCFTQRVSNSQVVAQHIRKVTPMMASNPHAFARTFASKSKQEVEEEEEEDVTGERHIDEAAKISTYRVSPETVEKLKAKGITSFFPIQYETYDLIYDGFDLVGRARTGTGKTLSFALPILEKLKQSPPPSRLRGRKPRVLIMSPTRELAKQIAAEIEGLSDLSTTTLYGGTPMQPQEMELRSGVDVVVGTPGRIQDFLEREVLSFEDIQYVVLDEADEMLRVGFQESLDYILGQIPSEKDVQRLLFSATIPKWVSQIASKSLKPDHKVIDLIGDEIVKSSETITHFAIECSTQHQLETLADVVRVYSKGGNTLVFATTKKEATEIATSSSIAPICQVLHGDISQDQREITLNAFKKGKFSVLVATDVAARGLDIPKIDLVINCRPPEQPENYIHRVGRTGRAGRTGTAITFYTRRYNERDALQNIESHVGIKMSRIGTPQLSEIVKAVYDKVKLLIDGVDKNLVDAFSANAKQMIADRGGDSVSVLAGALAHLSGYATTHKVRSLLTGTEGYTTLLFKMREPTNRTTTVMDWLRNSVTGTKEARVTQDGNVIVDVYSEDAEKIVGAKIPSKYDRIEAVEVPTVLPEIVEEVGGYKRNEGGGFRSRNEGGFRSRNEGGFKSRNEGFRSRNNEGGGFRSRNEGFKSRNNEGYQGKSDYKPFFEKKGSEEVRKFKSEFKGGAKRSKLFDLYDE